MAEMKLDYLGKYRVIDEIGLGRFSIVYRAEHPLLKKMVAVKLMLPTLFNNPELIKRFTHEASAAAAIKHENIAQVIDLVEEKDRLFMVMEYMPAGNLHDFAQKHGRLNFRQIAHIIRDIAAALDFAHNQDSVHGDIKPGNILLTDDGNARLTDFGILRAVEIAGVTSSELTRGTPHYISPEQAEGEHPTRFSDQYALGVVAYELFTGKVPFDGNTPLAIYLKHVRETVPPASQSNPLITTRLDAIINQALAKEPSKRFPDCATFARALSQSLTATESKQYQDLATQASAALKAYDPKTARPLIEAAMQIASDEASSSTLLEKLQASEQIQQSYANARKSLAAARAMASKLRSAKNHPADPQGVMDRLSPLPPPLWKTILRRIRPALLLTLAFGLLGILLSITGMTYTNLTANGALSKATLVAVARTSTPIPPTITPTLTLTPTSTLTPIPTLTRTPIPTLGPGSILKRSEDKMAMVYVPAGPFTMGSKNGQEDEKPVHTVTLPAYWLDQTEVTNDMYNLCTQAKVCQPPASSSSASRRSYFGDPAFGNYPVIYVNWNQAISYCKWVGARLPSEAEWEKAARGSDARTFPWGDDLDKHYANFFGGTADTTRVADFKIGKSPFGIYDLAGNVWEWVSSEYKPYPYKATDGRENLETGGNRVLRGGSWYYYSDLARSSFRYWDEPTYVNFDVGFRCARDDAP